MNSNFLGLIAVLTGIAAIVFFYVSEKKRERSKR